jgi:CBS domain containing-hemolysin-like protein
MESEASIFTLIFFALCAVLSAFFSGSEAAFLSLSENEKAELRKGPSSRTKRFENLLSDTKELSVSLKLAVIGVNTALVCTAFFLVNDYLAQFQFGFWATLVIVLALIATLSFLINELWAKLIVLKYNIEIAKAVSLPIVIYVQLMTPLTKVIAKALTYLASKLGVTNRKIFLEHQKIMAAVENGDRMDELEATERAMIDSIVTFGETEVHEIMIPRTDMVCVEENTSLLELIRLIKDKGHTRIPLYHDGIDHILGIFHAKDLLSDVVAEAADRVDLRALARPAYFVPETKKVHLLLKEFQKDKYHMAIVVDEYGGTAGLVTLEDVLEEIVGEIQDEYDKELPLYRKLDDDTYMVDAKIDLHEFNEKLELDLPTEGEYESLGGFILSLTGYVPEEQEVVKYNGYAFTVEKIERNRIVQIKVRRAKQESEPNSSTEEP